MTETQQQRTWPEEVTGGRSQPGLPGTPVPRAPDGVSARRPRGPPAHNSESSGPRSQELAPLSRALYSRSGQDKTVTRELHARIAHVRTHTAYQTRTCGCSFLADKWRTRFESPPQTPDEPTPRLHSPHWTSCAGTEHGLGRGGGSQRGRPCLQGTPGICCRALCHRPSPRTRKPTPWFSHLPPMPSTSRPRGRVRDPRTVRDSAGWQGDGWVPLRGHGAAEVWGCKQAPPPPTDRHRHFQQVAPLGPPIQGHWRRTPRLQKRELLTCPLEPHSAQSLRARDRGREHLEAHTAPGKGQLVVPLRGRELPKPPSRDKVCVTLGKPARAMLSP